MDKADGLWKVVSDSVDRVFLWMSCFMLAVALFVGAIEVFSRYVLGVSRTFTTDLLVALILWGVFLVAPIITRADTHIKVDIVPLLLKGKARQVIDIINHVVTLLFCAFMVWGGIQASRASIRLDLRTDNADYPYAILYGGLIIGMFLTVLYAGELAFRRRKTK